MSSEKFREVLTYESLVHAVAGAMFGQHRQLTERARVFSSLRSVVQLLLIRIKKNGFLGLFKGLEAKILQTVLTAALMFLLYEKIASSTFRVMGG